MSIERISTEEFEKEGYLQEVNRTFLHPLGLNLIPITAEPFFAVEDYRDDPEGCMFPEGSIDPEKRKNINRLKEEKRDARFEAVGGFLQTV